MLPAKKAPKASENGELAPYSEPNSHFFLEEKYIRRLKPGMKLKLVNLADSTSIFSLSKKWRRYLSDLLYEFLPQELMLDYKEPIPNERAQLPSVDDPDAGIEEVLRTNHALFEPVPGTTRGSRLSFSSTLL